jgi:hypothetical protein
VGTRDRRIIIRFDRWLDFVIVVGLGLWCM